MNFEYIDRDMMVIYIKFWYDWLYQFTGFFAGAQSAKQSGIMLVSKTFDTNILLYYKK